MKRWFKIGMPCAAMAVVTISLIAVADDDDVTPAPDAAAAQASLTPQQQQSGGIVVARPESAKAPEEIFALGLVLDATTMLAEMGDSIAGAAAAHSTEAEVQRLRALLQGGAGASQRQLETAQAEQAKTRADADVATARLALHWGPLVTQTAAARQKIIDAAIAGHGLLVRADLPGRHSLGAIPAKALIDVDGIEVAGLILGVLRQNNESQSVGLLINVENAPAGLGPGARVPVRLMSAARSGVRLPRDAVLYDENGAYVYKRFAATADGKLHYAAVKVNLLLPFGDGWLVDGVDNDDDIVVRGAGVLWSLQGVGSRALDADDD